MYIVHGDVLSNRTGGVLVHGHEACEQHVCMPVAVSDRSDEMCSSTLYKGNTYHIILNCSV